MDFLNVVGPDLMARVSAQGRPRWKWVLFPKGDL